jgi:hypothetical protein
MEGEPGVRQGRRGKGLSRSRTSLELSEVISWSMYPRYHGTRLRVTVRAILVRTNLLDVSRVLWGECSEHERRKNRSEGRYEAPRTISAECVFHEGTGPLSSDSHVLGSEGGTIWRG